ncbi:peptidyl-glycine alpha-amidating monooxygenase B-like [Pollicipes pollicipes]|uniref:peptidyl-glycine alpha-amidating monooxygenase B-like n=1 Tax=Pollicipes pollicipes TaxID=41117 RepID=UPI0018853268|nr:peptidyl-glycine alpha-amidating monooxygenase B-like [Pollicipes pollicipes]
MLLVTLLLLLTASPALFMRLYPPGLPTQFYRDLGNVIVDQMDLPSMPSPLREGHWPRSELRVGQAAGISVDLNDRPQVFHRGNVTWDSTSFNRSHHYQHRGRGPIRIATLLTLEKGTGAVLRSEGAGRFYLPHGLHIDGEGNRWVTDVAMHQVFKLPPDSDTPTLTLGVAFEPGYDDAHFCKPTDVAVADDGTIFVADGYCNSRIMIFNRDGRHLGSFGEREGMEFVVPHSLALEGAVLCVADRENSRLVCWNVREPFVQPQVVDLQVYGPVYAVAPAGAVLFTLHHGRRHPSALTLDLATGRVIDNWPAAKSLNQPHDLAVSSDGRTIYVVELTPARVVKFLVDPDLYEHL